MAGGINTVSPLSRVSNELPSDNKARAPINRRHAAVSSRSRCKGCENRRKRGQSSSCFLFFFTLFFTLSTYPSSSTYPLFSNIGPITYASSKMAKIPSKILSIEIFYPSIHPSRFLTPTNKQNNREESATRWMTSRVPSSLFYLRIRSRGTTVFDKSRNGFATRSTLLSLSLFLLSPCLVSSLASFDKFQTRPTAMLFPIKPL